MRYERREQIKTDLVCPFCGEVVELTISDGAYSGYCENEWDMPEDVQRGWKRTFKNGKTRYYFHLPGYMPHCSNKMCFLRSANRVFKSPELAKEAWIEGTRER